jgi:hypothetical protein
MKTTIETSTDLCPLVNICMYQSTLGLDYQLENYIEYMELPIELGEQVFNESILDTKGYIRALESFTWEYLKENIELPLGIEFKKVHEIVSPREYNFTGDRLDFDLKAPKDIRDQINNYLEATEDLGVIDSYYKFYSDNYGSHSGFTSFAPMLNDALEASNSTHDLYLVSSFVAWYCNEQIDQSIFEMDFNEYIEIGEYLTLPESLENEITRYQ